MSKIIAPLAEIPHLLVSLLRMSAGINSIDPEMFVDRVVQD